MHCETRLLRQQGDVIHWEIYVSSETKIVDDAIHWGITKKGYPCD